MCFVFTCGETSFRKEVEGYEGVVCQCHNCGNTAAHVIKTNPWFTFCFIPVIPLSMKGYTDVVCTICNFAQPLENRPDVLSRKGMGGQGVPLQQQYGPPQGWNGPQHYNGPSPPPGNQPMRYG